MVRIIAFWVYSNIWIATVAAGFSWLCWQNGDDIQQQWIRSVYIYLFTFLVYNFQRYVKLMRYGIQDFAHLRWMSQHRQLLLTLFSVHFVFLCYWCWQFPDFLWMDWWGLFIGALVAVAYVLPQLLPPLRQIPYTKILWVSIVFTYLTQYWASNTLINQWAMPFFVLYVMAICILFDFRDRDQDDRRLHTFGQLFSKRALFRILSVLLVVSLLGSLWLSGKDVLFIGTAILLHLSALTWWYKTEWNHLQYSLAGEGCMMLLGVGSFWFSN